MKLNHNICTCTVCDCASVQGFFKCWLQRKTQNEAIHVLNINII